MSPKQTGRDGKLKPKDVSTISTNTYASTVAPLDILSRIFSNPPWPHPRPAWSGPVPHLHLIWAQERLSNPQNSTWPKDCIELPHANSVTFNTTALSNPDLLTLSLTSDTPADMILESLVDSGSSDCFINSTFIQTQHVSIYGILPIWLHSIITQALNLQTISCQGLRIWLSMSLHWTRVAQLY